MPNAQIRTFHSTQTLATEGIPKDIKNDESVAGIATRYGLGRSGDRIPVEARLSATVQTAHRAHRASYTVRIGSFPRIKQQARGVKHLSHLVPMLKKE